MKCVPRLGSGDVGARNCVTVSNFVLKCEPRSGSGDLDVRNCVTVSKFGHAQDLAMWMFENV